MMKKFSEGQRAFLNNLSVFENPYPGNTIDFSMWNTGWQDAHLTYTTSYWTEFQCGEENDE